MSLQSAAEGQRLVRPSVVAKRCQLKTGTLAKWRMLGQGPRYAKLGGRVVYDLADVDAWIEARKRSTDAA